MMKSIIKPILRPLYNHYTAGESIKSLERKILELRKKNLYPIPDFIKEKAKTKEDIDGIITEYKKLSHNNTFKHIALKLSSFNFEYDKIDNVINNLILNGKIVLIDAEEVAVQDKINEYTNDFIKKYNIKEANIFKTYQMYRKDSLATLNKDIATFKFLGVKLVRGAYYKTDLETNKLYLNKKDTDNDFNDAMYILINYHIDSFICTHNKKDINMLIRYASWSKAYDTSNIYHASLYGFINDETNELIEANIKTYKYLPYGLMEDAIPYLSRRLEENPQVIKYLF